MDVTHLNFERRFLRMVVHALSLDVSALKI